MTKAVRPLTLDQRLINRIGRIPFSLFFGAASGIIVEFCLRLFRYFYDITDWFSLLDNINNYLTPAFRLIAFYGAIGGVIVGFFTSISTIKIESRIKRALLGIIMGLAARLLTEFLIRLVKEGNARDAWDYVILLRHNLIPAGIIVGMLVGLLPLQKKENLATENTEVSEI